MEKEYKYALFASGGNDSIALIQHCRDRGLKGVHVIYSNTGWAADYWEARITAVEKWVWTMGYDFHITESIGMEQLVHNKKAWPRGGGGKFQFCTEELKKKPAREWLDKHDPDKEMTCVNGIRREESRNRIDSPEWVTESEGHGGRELWSPLVRHTEEMRDALISKTPFRVLPYKSKECWPCVNAGKKELKNLEASRILMIADIEKAAGINSKGNARVMFSPRRHNGAIGIEDVVNDAKKGSDDLFQSTICNTGWCHE